VEDGLKQVLGEEFGGWERVELQRVFRVMLEDYKKKREGQRREGVEEGDNGQGESSQGSPASR
jgi:hypothetical protein